MVDEDDFTDEPRERLVEEVVVTQSALTQRIIVPRQWGPASLIATAERGALLLYSFTEMPHLLCWRLPDDADVLIEILPDNDDRAREAIAGPTPREPSVLALNGDSRDDDADDTPSTEVWLLPDQIDEERLRYPAAWGRPSPVVDGWVDGGALLLTFDDGEHVLRWDMAEDILLSLIADDEL